MLLRRMIEHVKTQNWTAVGLDFVIVVVGVFIGIQVSNWNDARANRGIVAAHLSEIAEDLRTHLDFHDKLYDSAIARIAAVDYIYAEAFDRKLPDVLRLSVEAWPVPETPPVAGEDLDVLMGSVNLIRITVGSRNGYESLINSGHLGLIENRELARNIQQYYNQYDDVRDTAGDVFRPFRNDGVLANYKYGVSVFDERPAAEIIEIARENEEFAAYLRSAREWGVVHAVFLEELKTSTEALLGEIERELERIA
ncbi:MAG: hypothetical protein AAFW81_01100 [Pseudomonadota bacterium]